MQQNVNGEVDQSASGHIAMEQDDGKQLSEETKKMIEDEQKHLEELSIKAARKNAMGDVIRSAEPYNFFQDPSQVPYGYMSLVVGVYFKTDWFPTTHHIVQLLDFELGYEKIRHDKIQAIGRNGKHITLQAKSKQIKREIVNTLTQAKFKG